MQLTMVIHESSRLYSAVPLLSRNVFKDMKFGNIDVPKGTELWILIISLLMELLVLVSIHKCICHLELVQEFVLDNTWLGYA